MLIGNYSVLQKSPTRFLAGSTASVEGQVRSNFGKTGMNRNRFYTDMTTTAKVLYAVPEGNYGGKTWILPQRSGSIASRNAATATLSGNATGAMGVNAIATASFAVSVADTPGQLISSGTGSGSFTINTSSPLLTASLAAVGSATLSLSATGSLRADAHVSGTGTMTFSAGASILPLNDASPLRSATATFAINGALTPYAIGKMVGSTIDSTILTSDSIASSVWAALSATNNVAGTMGQKVNSAAAGGVDYSALGAAVWSVLAGEADTPGSIGAAVQAGGMTTNQADMLAAIAKIHGLVPGVPLVVTSESRSAGDVVQTISEASGTVTISRVT